MRQIISLRALLTFSPVAYGAAKCLKQTLNKRGGRFLLTLTLQIQSFLLVGLQNGVSHKIGSCPRYKIPRKYPTQWFQNDFKLVFLFWRVPRSREPVYHDNSRLTLPNSSPKKDWKTCLQRKKRLTIPPRKRLCR